VIDGRINVWAGLDTEAHCERIARRAREIRETANRIMQLSDELEASAKRGDRAAERAQDMLSDSVYEAFADAQLEKIT
jgi:hypothetical protein